MQKVNPCVQENDMILVHKKHKHDIYKSKLCSF